MVQRFSGSRFNGWVRMKISLDEAYISRDEFDNTYELVRRTRAAIHGFINYLEKYKSRTETQPK